MVGCPSVCLSRRSTAAAACGWFAAECGRGQQILIAADAACLYQLSIDIHCRRPRSVAFLIPAVIS